MEKEISLTSGECEIVTRLVTKAIAKEDLHKLEEQDARSVRKKIIDSEVVLKI